MSIDELQRRDARIAELFAKGRAGRTRDEDHELATLDRARELHWRRLPMALAAVRRKAADLESYARQIGFNFEEPARG